MKQWSLKVAFRSLKMVPPRLRSHYPRGLSLVLKIKNYRIGMDDFKTLSYVYWYIYTYIDIVEDEGQQL